MQHGFTIVELLVVIVVIAVLAAVTVVSYNGITKQTKEVVLKSDLSNAARKIHTIKIETGAFPTDTSGIPPSSGTTFGPLQRTASTFCLEASNSSGKTYYVTENTAPKEGVCPAIAMQNMDTASCPASRTLAVDARDNRTYWIQKMADGKCWMLTSLAYGGGGADTYGDTKNITLAVSGGSYVQARYYVHGSANATASPAQPSTTTDGGATNPQFGYHYNWCAAMGVQAGTSACLEAASPLPNSSISICPAGWRLPVSGPSGGEFQTLVTSIGATDDSAGSVIMRSVWLAQLSGSWDFSFYEQLARGDYWSSTQSSAFSPYYLNVGTAWVAAIDYNDTKDDGKAVRCIASS